MMTILLQRAELANKHDAFQESLVRINQHFPSLPPLKKFFPHESILFAKNTLCSFSIIKLSHGKTLLFLFFALPSAFPDRKDKGKSPGVQQY